MYGCLSSLPDCKWLLLVVQGGFIIISPYTPVLFFNVKFLGKFHQSNVVTLFGGKISFHRMSKNLWVFLFSTPYHIKDTPTEATEMLQSIKYEDKREVFDFKVHSFSTFEKSKNMMKLIMWKVPKSLILSRLAGQNEQ